MSSESFNLSVSRVELQKAFGEFLKGNKAVHGDLAVLTFDGESLQIECAGMLVAPRAQGDSLGQVLIPAGVCLLLAKRHPCGDPIQFSIKDGRLYVGSTSVACTFHPAGSELFKRPINPAPARTPEPQPSDIIVQVFSPIYLLRARERCWKCHSPQEVIAILTCRLQEQDPECGEYLYENEPILLHNVTQMPAPILSHIQSLHVRFEKRQSRTAETAYYMNTCPCGAHFGDFYLFSEPGGAFFPLSPEDAACVTIEKLPFSGTFDFVCTYGIGPGAPLFDARPHTTT